MPYTAQGEYTLTHWMDYETGEAVHTAYRVVIWIEPVEVEVDMNLRGFIHHFQFRGQTYHDVNVTNCTLFKWPNNMPAGGYVGVRSRPLADLMGRSGVKPPRTLRVL